MQVNNNYQNLVDGQWVFAKSGKLMQILSPVDGSVVGSIPLMSGQDIDDVIDVSRKSLHKWEQKPLYKRAEIMRKAAYLLDERAEEIADILVMEVAKQRTAAVSEVKRTADFLRFTADAAKSLEGTAVNGENFPGGSKNKLSYIKRVPLGVVLAIAPFNYPVNLSASKVAPALIAGNCVILKPPTQGAISALHMIKAFNDAGIPAGALSTVTGQGSVIGDYIIKHKGIDFINFTGSTQIGKHISEIASMTPILMELGGKDAAIVLEDADLEFTAKNIVDGAFSYSGQRCTALKRILATDDVANKLIPMLLNNIKTLSVGDPRDNCYITPLIDTKSADFAEELIKDAVNKGAKVLIGAKRTGNIIYPTLIDNVTEDMDIAWIEPFAPILPIIRVDGVEKAIDIANKSEYGLQSSVFTNDINKAFYVAERLDVGTVQINNKTERGPDHFPFLGVKSSGLGTQGIKYSIEAMTRLKAIIINLH